MPQQYASLNGASLIQINQGLSRVRCRDRREDIDVLVEHPGQAYANPAEGDAIEEIEHHERGVARHRQGVTRRSPLSR
jgi:hypothetical protein